jgi:hypothetical protein
MRRESVSKLVRMATVAIGCASCLWLVGCHGAVGNAPDGSAGAGTGHAGTGGQSAGGSGGNAQAGSGGGSPSDAAVDRIVVGNDGPTQPGLAHAPFVAVGYAAMRAFSADGKSWIVAPAPSPLPAGWSGPPVSGDNQWLFRGGCYGGGKFVAVGGTANSMGLLMSSTDGSSWTVVGGMQSNDDCAYGQGHFVTNGRTSPDGVTWTLVPGPVSARQMVFGGGIFIAAGDNGGGAIAYSTDGQSWGQLPISYVGTDGARKGYNAAAYGGGHFIAVNTGIVDAPIFEWDGATAQSFSETPRTTILGSNVAITAVAYGRGAFVIATDGFIYRRPDGATTWDKSAYSGASGLASLVITDDLYVTAAAWSVDGIAWSPSTNPPAEVTRIVPTVGP